MGSLIKKVLELGGSVRGIAMDTTKVNIQSFANNPTIANYRDGLVINIRKQPYFLLSVNSPDRMEFELYNHDVYSYNTIGYLESVIESQGRNFKALNPGHGPYKIMGQYTGYEDMRLVVWNDDLYGIVSRPDIVENKVVMQLIRFNEELDMVDSWVFETPNHFEKNWLPIEGKPFNFLYDPTTAACLNLDINNYREADDLVAPTIINQITPPNFSGGLCGSSQVIAYQDGYICLCHSRYDWKSSGEIRHIFYKHYFVRFDSEMHPVSISEPFSFINESVEYCCGLVQYGDKIYITFSLCDGCCGLLEIPVSHFDELLQCCDTNSLIDFTAAEVEDVACQLIKDSDLNSQYVLALNYLSSEHEQLLHDIVIESRFATDKHSWSQVILQKILKSKHETPLLLEMIK